MSCSIIPVPNDNVVEVTLSTTELTLNAPLVFVGDLDETIDDRVSELLISGSGINLNYNDITNTLIISATGLQLSGNYANTIHSHVSSDISDFNSSVSGLLPVKDIVAGSGVVISSNSGIYNISSTISIIDNSIEYNDLSNSSDESINITKRLAKAWINFNGVGTISIRDDFNISNIVDNGVGNYTINFSQPFLDTNYTFVTWSRDYNTDNTIINNFGARSNTSKTASSLSLIYSNDNNAVVYDSPELNVIFYGN